MICIHRYTVNNQAVQHFNRVVNKHFETMYINDTFDKHHTRELFYDALGLN